MSVAEENFTALQQQTDLVDFRRNFPPPTPIIKEALSSALTELQSSPKLIDDLRFPRFNGSETDRAAGAAWLEQRFKSRLSEDRIVLSNGTNSTALMLLAQIARPGGTLLTETLTYPAMKPLARLLGIQVHGIEMDGDGIRPDALADVAKKTGAGVLHCIPTFQNPTTAVMSRQRRQEIADVARRHDLQIFEDDVYGILLEEGPAPVAAYAPERTWYMLGMSKSVSLQLRITYLLTPEGVLPSQYFWPATMTTNWMPAPLPTEVATKWILNGTAARLLTSVREETAERQLIALEALKGVKFRTHAQCFHLWLDLPSGWSSDAFAERARRLGVAVSSTRSFAVYEASAPNNVRLGLGVPADRAVLKASLDALRNLISDEPY
ncbi:PLP-dependent aminotransferase family protein [Bradyrhizobium sp. Arg62]|uniref:aminotransferase-like domain-containing protein n=1 Tax=Bradyrhizobium brasilense TaxID=1419277 RepID=UPI001E358996|nr:PLP-dependent aminotransferase family protein [Bradyrhizobium brasilense]MCC8944213.1 PLP-dependent aminotransferase family protein [Bradyrhizobium brasilense]